VPPDTLVLTRYASDQLPAIRPTLVEVYAQVYADQLDDPFFSPDRFAERLDAYASRPGWQAVVGHERGQVAGYAFGAALAPGAAWWRGMLEPLPPQDTAEDGARTFALYEIMLRSPWRGTGAAERIHEELLAGRTEQRATLLVETAHPRVKALYQRWGYRHLGDQRPFPDAPLYATMLREPLRA
jgi:GNAT superfamily N-acetyltransferase